MKIKNYIDISRSDFLRHTKYCIANENYAKHEIIFGFDLIFADKRDIIVIDDHSKFC
jgi:hypothetical protein